jgi:precorrin-4 methylase
MSLTEEITEVKAKIAALEQQLTSESLSEQERHDIRQQIIENTKLLTELYKQNASTGKKYSVHSIRKIPKNLLHNEVNHSYNL